MTNQPPDTSGALGDEPVEEWRPVQGFEGLYEVSNLGNIRSLSRRTASRFGLKLSRGRILTPHVGDQGYKRVSLSRQGVGKHATVHRLVALAFLPLDPARPQVNHIDSDRANNIVTNLEWCTASENALHAIKNVGPMTAKYAKGALPWPSLRTRCPKGHAYAGDNLYIGPNGDRLCRTCRRERGQATKLRNKERRTRQLIQRTALKELGLLWTGMNEAAYIRDAGKYSDRSLNLDDLSFYVHNRERTLKGEKPHTPDEWLEAVR